MLSNVDLRKEFMMRGSDSNSSLDSIQNELELLLLEQKNRDLILERERELDINRSGSAPPTVEGSLRSAGLLDGSGGVLTEEEIRSHPAYLEYYYSNENLNPRLPPPLLSKEDWRVAQRLRGLGSLSDWRNKNAVDNGRSSSLFSMQPVNKTTEDESIELRKAALRNISRKNSAVDLVEKGSDGASSSEMGAKRKSFADIVQEGNGTVTASQSSVTDALDSRGISNINASEVQNKTESLESMLPEKVYAGLSNPQNIGTAFSNAFASSVSSALTNSGNEPLRRCSGPGLNVGGGVLLADNLKSLTSNIPKVSSPSIFEIADAAASLSEYNMLRDRMHAENILQSAFLSKGHPHNQQQNFFDTSRAEMMVNGINYADFLRNSGNLNISNSLINERMNLPRRTLSTTNLQSQINPSDFTTLEDLNIRRPCRNFSDISLGSLLAGAGATGNGLNMRSRSYSGLNFPIVDPNQIQYIRNGGPVLGNSSQGRRAASPYDHDELEALETAFFQALLQRQKQEESLFLQKRNIIDHQYPYLGNPSVIASSNSHQRNQGPRSLQSKVSSRNPMFQNEGSAQFLPLRNLKGESASSQSGNNAKVKLESLLEMIKNNKTKSLGLQDVLSHVIDFSMDQYGSRFIQHKLETASPEEKMLLCRKIIPHARGLMVDVFGNYVIQKFFENGTDAQRVELARTMIGHVLPLSLQMYGCRVVQKAIEVVDVEAQTELVAELDGSVMKCIRDQNGNHVIQKCIECIPPDRIQFIISSFLGQVVSLSTHPYGCRVIQRVLERCADPKIHEVIMHEIVKSVCNLAQDQYGNYVVQHVLQHGKPQERSAIIRKLAGQIVKMSQQKFASNVVEKCLTFGGPEERKLLVNEMLGSTDENEPLQVMMKDPFGNYVVQKVLETCDDHSRELIISRIKVHLHTLKKYTYGKHIVSRVEKLVATGEKHMGQTSS